MDQSFDTRLKLDKRSVIRQAHHPPAHPRADRILPGHIGPGISGLLLQTERDTAGLPIVFQHVDFHTIADSEHFRRMADTAPRHIRDMEQAVDSAEVDKRPVIGDVLDHTLNQLAFLQIRQRRLTLLVTRFFKEDSTGHHHIAPAMVDLDDLQREGLADEAVQITHGVEIDL